MSLDILNQNNSNKSQESSPPIKKRISMTWILPMLLLLGFISIFLLLFGPRMMPAMKVSTAKVLTLRASDDEKKNASSATNTMLFQASGWIEPKDYTTYVPTLINGIVDELLVLEGAWVKKGQLLATLIDDEQQLLLQMAKQKCVTMEGKIEAKATGIPIVEAQIAAANKKIVAVMRLLDKERDNLKRLESIGKSAVSEQSIVQARFSVARHEALVAEVEAELPELRAKIAQISAEKKSMLATLDELKIERARAQLDVDRTKIFAPHDGMVTQLHAAPGKKRLLQMDDPTSALIVELYDPSNIQARIDVPLSEASDLAIGQHVEMVSDLSPNSVLTGDVIRITGHADIQRNTIQAKVVIKNPDLKLRPGMLVRAKFFAPSNKNSIISENGSRLSLFVPESSIVDGSKVWVVSPSGVAEFKSIKLANDRRDDYLRVVSGIKSGERLILPPHNQLAQGMRVEEFNPPK